MSYPISIVKTKHEKNKKSAVISQFRSPKGRKKTLLFLELPPGKISPARFHPPLSSIGVVDLHYHGGFGIDLDDTTPLELDELSYQLARNGVAAFCPTTRSLSKQDLRRAVRTLGSWTAGLISKARNSPHPIQDSCLPLGIHLEGPFLAPSACGAHTPRNIRPFDFEELSVLWNESQQTLKIITLAPEAFGIGGSDEFYTKRGLVRQLVNWCKARKIRLNLGHSRADQATAQLFLDHGFSGVTHGWNAMAFHHREPGILGAALGSDGVWLELIVDGKHVAPVVLDWTLKLHPPQRVCFVSDCVSGPSVLKNGTLAGASQPLSQTFVQWACSQAPLKMTTQPIETQVKLLKKWIPYVTTGPLRSLEIEPKLQQKLLRVGWRLKGN